MMSNNKILTVSYGTFSCTLEGFDDSFGTMKAIAEYFRGLSSDAPYFGAEPPQPDADMLARIAQKEISRRVEAREHEGKIHLSAIENRSENEAPQALSDTGRDKAAADIAVSDVIADAAEDAAQVVVPEAPIKTADDAKHHAPEITPAASDTLAETAEHIAEEKVEEDAPAPAVVENAADAPTTDVVEDENDIVPGQPDADVEAFFANTMDVTSETFEDQETIAEAVEPSMATMNAQNESIAAKLQRIRAVVAQRGDVKDDDDFVEDQHAEAGDVDETEPEHLMADARRDIEDALDADEAADKAVEGSIEEEDNDDISAILGRLDAADAVELTELDEDIVAEPHASTETDTALDNLFGYDEDEDDVDLADVELEDKVAPVADPVVEATEPAPTETPRTPRARVIKVKRADLEAAIENGELEEYVDAQDDGAAPTLDDLAPAKNAQSSLTAEDEAELARELAELEADMSPAKASLSEDLDLDASDDLDISADLDDEDDHEETQPAAATTARRELPSMDDAKSNDLDRLLAETDQQMDEPESATRRNAFSHLRAAVAAKKADVAMGATDAKEDEDDAYRNDLADVVRPRRPVNGSARTERPGEGRPAPLKLVAEQRIDVAEQRPAGPVRPRRVAAVTEAASTDPSGDSFADYAAEMGATKLPQLLEAAASYMSFVEGRDQFSRPQLMTKVRQVGPEDGFSREDGLRSFGQLLRAGKIEKIKGGRFTVSEDIGFRPDHRAAS